MSNIPSREEVERELAKPECPETDDEHCSCFGCCYCQQVNTQEASLANRILKALWEEWYKETRSTADGYLYRAMRAATSLYEETLDIRQGWGTSCIGAPRPYWRRVMNDPTLECHECGGEAGLYEPAQAYVCANYKCGQYGLLFVQPGVLDTYAQEDRDTTEASDEQGGEKR